MLKRNVTMLIKLDFLLAIYIIIFADEVYLFVRYVPRGEFIIELKAIFTRARARMHARTHIKPLIMTDSPAAENNR